MMERSALPPLFLGPDEVETLTGFKTPMRQIDWLRTKGWRFEMSGSRRPVIARRYAEKMLGCGNDDEQRPRPNFGALLRAV